MCHESRDSMLPVTNQSTELNKWTRCQRHSTIKSRTYRVMTLSTSNGCQYNTVELFIKRPRYDETLAAIIFSDRHSFCHVRITEDMSMHSLSLALKSTWY